MRGALLVAGTGSDAGKSVVVAGLCRWLSRLGVRVAPFKAQNMALNSVVTADGGEIGRAQAAQAAAARVPPRAAMNPVLLKPGGERTSHVVVRGRAYADVDAVGYRAHKPALFEVALTALGELRSEFDVVVCEGAGSPAEVNLRDGDIANMGLARAADLPVVVVGDIDRGGLFAHLAGTVAVLDPADQRHVAAFVVNKFRGDPALLRPGLDWLQRTTGRPCLGVLPWTPGLWLDAEDSLDLAYRPTTAAPGAAPAAPLRVAVIRLPRMSNVGDVDPLTVEPGVAVQVTTSAADVMDADLAVLPGTRATVHDLEWLRATGLADAVLARAAAGRPVLGVCGGLQMLGRQIVDDVESGRGTVAGLSLLDVTTTFRRDKTLALTTGEWRGEPVSGFVIHHGRVVNGGDEPFLGGSRSGSVAGTPWHGIFENDGFRRAFLTEVARVTASTWEASQTRFADVREARLDILADLVETHLDTSALRALVETGVPDGLPRLALSRQDERAPAVAAR